MDKNVFAVKIPQLQRYLEFSGWSKDSTYKNESQIVFKNDSFGLRIALPSDESFSDFYPSLQNFFSVLSSFEDRPEEQILSDVLMVCLDRIEFRIITSVAQNGKLPLEYAAECIEGIKELVLYSADAVNNAKPVCQRPSRAAYSALQSFSFAQTSFGSFVFNVDTEAMPQNCQQLALIEDIDFSTYNHKVVKRIHTAIQQVESITENSGHLYEAAESAYITGINANMCEALLKLQPLDGEVNLVTTFKYASALRGQQDRQVEFSISDNHFAIISELERIYYNKKTVEDAELTGYVRMLTKKMGREVDYEEKVIRLDVDYEGRKRIVNIELSAEDYRLACDAHRDGIRVKTAGLLDKSGKFWELSQLLYFQIDE